MQATIVSKNETCYKFFQYKSDGDYNVTRPINSNLFIHERFDDMAHSFIDALKHIKEIKDSISARECINRIVYTCQQAIGATLDALPRGKSNKAKKINGDLFERFIRIIISDIGVSVREGTVRIPVIVDGKHQFNMSYQHDLIVERDRNLVAIGSVKTSSKDRIDKIFIDKLLYNRLIERSIPHFAVFLNDVQRSGEEPKFRVNSTFLAGHFKAYTVKLCPLDGVYYCDIRPNMRMDGLLADKIKELDSLLVEDIWEF